MNEENTKYELRSGHLIEGLLKVLYAYSQAARHINGDSKFLDAPAFLKAGKDELIKQILSQIVSPDAAKIFDFALEKKWQDLARLDEEQAITEGLKYLRTLHSKWQNTIRFAYGKRTWRDYPGYELFCDSKYDLSMTLTSHPETPAQVIETLRALARSFRLEFIRITYFKAGPHVVPSPEEVNDLSCWHLESDQKEGTMIKWAVQDGEAYKFVETNVIDHIEALLSAGATKIAVFHYHGPKPEDLGQSAAA